MPQPGSDPSTPLVDQSPEGNPTYCVCVYVLICKCPAWLRCCLLRCWNSGDGQSGSSHDRADVNGEDVASTVCKDVSMVLYVLMGCIIPMYYVFPASQKLDLALVQSQQPSCLSAIKKQFGDNEYFNLDLSTCEWVYIAYNLFTFFLNIIIKPCLPWWDSDPARGQHPKPVHPAFGPLLMGSDLVSLFGFFLASGLMTFDYFLFNKEDFCRQQDNTTRCDLGYDDMLCKEVFMHVVYKNSPFYTAIFSVSMKVVCLLYYAIRCRYNYQPAVKDPFSPAPETDSQHTVSYTR